MVTTTTKTLNYSITKGSSTNSVNATITSTPGFNSNYLGKVPGILKLLELILAIVAFSLVVSLREERRPVETLNPSPILNSDGSTSVQQPTGPGNTVATFFNYNREFFLVGEVYFLSAHSAAITLLIIILIAYLFHTTSAMIVPKATQVENVMNIVLALMLLAAGITEIVMTVMWHYDPDLYNNGTYSNYGSDGRYRPLMANSTYAMRLAAGALAIINGILFLVSYFMSKKELEGPKTL